MAATHMLMPYVKEEEDVAGRSLKGAAGGWGGGRGKGRAGEGQYWVGFGLLMSVPCAVAPDAWWGKQGTPARTNAYECRADGYTSACWPRRRIPHSSGNAPGRLRTIPPAQPHTAATTVHRTALPRMLAYDKSTTPPHAPRNTHSSTYAGHAPPSPSPPSPSS